MAECQAERMSKSAADNERGPYAGDAKLFVANLYFHVDEEELERLFSKYGSVSDVRINYNKLTGRSKGFAFITMDDARDAADAVKDLHNTELHGRIIKVEVAHGAGSEYKSMAPVRQLVQDAVREESRQNSDIQGRRGEKSSARHAPMAREREYEQDGTQGCSRLHPRQNNYSHCSDRRGCTYSREFANRHTTHEPLSRRNDYSQRDGYSPYVYDYSPRDPYRSNECYSYSRQSRRDYYEGRQESSNEVYRNRPPRNSRSSHDGPSTQHDRFRSRSRSRESFNRSKY
mmetsp:Transcript_15835/g.23831  ORF Transcript_15835/g.23831 Transcript_15835/m.23831 type:complete len:287 (+) Transcript_15835:65-925(+)